MICDEAYWDPPQLGNLESLHTGSPVKTMRPSMKFRKHVEDLNCLDRISSFSDELLGRVLSFLPTRCAVRTSILSTRWRYLFTFANCLSFDDAPCFDHLEQNERIESNQRFKDFVDKVLELHQTSPIKKFSLVCKATYGASDFNRWFSNVLQKGVQELHYELAADMDCLPDYDGFFTSETLASLKMIDWGLYKVKIPLSASLPKLKILHLEHIIFLDLMSMERLFSCCKLLEELTLVACDCNTNGHAVYSTGILKVLTIKDCHFLLGTVEIDTPNLAYLTYISNIGLKIVPSWKYSFCFVRAELVFEPFPYDDPNTDEEKSRLYEREILKAAACKATNLRFLKDSVQVLLPLDAGEQMPDFDILSMLSLAYFSYDEWQYVTSLIDKSPQLETIIFEKGFHCCYCSTAYCPDYCYCDSLSPSGSLDIPLDPFSCHVQVIEVRSFCGHMGPLSLMGHLLRNAVFLKSLRVITINDLDLEDELEVCKKLLRLPRASRDCYLDMN